MHDFLAISSFGFSYFPEKWDQIKEKSRWTEVKIKELTFSRWIGGF